MRLIERIRYEGDICFVIPPEDVMNQLDLKGGEEIKAILIKSYDPKMRVLTAPDAEFFFESDHHHPHHWEIPMDVVGRYNIKDLGYIEFKVIDVFKGHSHSS
jgi:hypothetical protein